MKPTTLCLLLKNNQILLAMKKRGFGAGKWNGVGGKVLEGESIELAAIREMKEEIGVDSDVADLENVGSIKFYFSDNPEFDQHMHVFTLQNWQGEPSETEEMKPQWFGFSEIPYATMWIDDKFWLPKVLNGKKIDASFYFREGGKILENQEVREI